MRLPFLILFLPYLALAKQPNVLLIMADDIGIEGFGCYGGTSYETPQIDKLAKGGLRFTHAYSQPLCTPTRIQIMTGRYNHRNWSYFGILDPAEKTFGHMMKEAGYKTCISGKWQLQSYDPPDFPNAERRRINFWLSRFICKNFRVIFINFICSSISIVIFIKSLF